MGSLKRKCFLHRAKNPGRDVISYTLCSYYSFGTSCIFTPVEGLTRQTMVQFGRWFSSDEAAHRSKCRQHAFGLFCASKPVRDRIALTTTDPEQAAAIL